MLFGLHLSVMTEGGISLALWHRQDRLPSLPQPEKAMSQTAPRDILGHAQIVDETE
jgi:hypothetical protein